MKAILLGSTGLTGNHLLKLLQKDDDFEKIVLLNRKPLSIHDPKVEEHIVNFSSLDKATSLFEGDVVYCCIGTTSAKTPDKEEYRAIDYGIPVQAAQIAKKNQIQNFIVVSAMGANAKSRIFYNRTKGEMQEAVIDEKIPNTYILQPSLIIGKRYEKRRLEKISGFFMKVFDFMIPTKYKAVHSKTIAKAMVYLTKNKVAATIIPSDQIQFLGKIEKG